MEENPWNIQSIYDLQYFNCPSCVYKNVLKQEFIDHAYHFHPESIQFVRNIKDGSLNDIEIPFVKDEDIDLKSELLLEDTNISDPTNGIVIKIEDINEKSEEKYRDVEPKSDPSVVIESLKIDTFFCDICHSYYCNQKALQNHKKVVHSKVNQNLNKIESNYDKDIKDNFEAKTDETFGTKVEPLPHSPAKHPSITHPATRTHFHPPHESSGKRVESLRLNVCRDHPAKTLHFGPSCHLTIPQSGSSSTFQLHGVSQEFNVGN